MCSEPKSRAVRRSRVWVLVAAILVVGGLGVGEARGDIQVHVMNCASSSTVTAQAFDAKDTVKLTPASSKDLSTGESGSLHCAGEGKGYCEMTISWKGKPERCYSTPTDQTGLKLDSGKWAVIKGFEIVNTTCQPLIGQYDSQPKSCEDVCGNCL